MQSILPSISAIEAYHMPFVLSPGELPFVMSRTHRHYDVDTKTYRELLAPFHWKNLPGDEGLAANRAILYTGQGSGDYLEPTIENVTGASEHGARFTPATPEEAAEIEAEEKYHRDIRNSMVSAVADLKLVEVPPYYITGQKNWQTVTPWYVVFAHAPTHPHTHTPPSFTGTRRRRRRARSASRRMARLLGTSLWRGRRHKILRVDTRLVCCTHDGTTNPTQKRTNSMEISEAAACIKLPSTNERRSVSPLKKTEIKGGDA